MGASSRESQFQLAKPGLKVKLPYNEHERGISRWLGGT